MAIFKLHTFYLPVYRELLPDDWKGESDPRAPRLLVRGPTVAEYTSMLSVSLSSASPRSDASYIVENITSGLEALRPMVRRLAGDWSLAGLDAMSLDHIPLNQLNELLDFALQAGRPDEERDIVPLGSGQEQP